MMYPAGMSNTYHVFTSKHWATMQKEGVSSYIFTGFVKKKWAINVNYEDMTYVLHSGGKFDGELQTK